MHLLSIIPVEIITITAMLLAYQCLTLCTFTRTSTQLYVAITLKRYHYASSYYSGLPFIFTWMSRSYHVTSTHIYLLTLYTFCTYRQQHLQRSSKVPGSSSLVQLTEGRNHTFSLKSGEEKSSAKPHVTFSDFSTFSTVVV